MVRVLSRRDYGLVNKGEPRKLGDSGNAFAHGVGELSRRVRLFGTDPL